MSYLINIVHFKSFFKNSPYQLSYCKYVTFRRFNFSTKPIPNELSAAYIPHEIENRSLEDNFFKPPLKHSKPFSMILPPPNITGTLHLGHALTATIQDVLIKWHRMRGYETMWIPGMDHAGIATQVIVEKKLWKERQQTRQQIGREKFYEEVFKWKDEKSKIIKHQLKRLGTSLDWQYEFFTMDAERSEAVNEAFVRLFEGGLIYESDYLVNWSCSLQSAISDIEVEHVSVPGPTHISVPGYDRPVEFGVLNKFAYKLQDSDKEIVVATTRPETILGDVAVAVHPNDDRYKSMIGKLLWHPFRNETIPIIADEAVDPKFGTGALKVTPAHDHTDYEIGNRHKLTPIEVIDEQGRLRTTCQRYDGMKRFKARFDILSALQELQLHRGKEDHAMTIPVCMRSKDVIEFLLKPQWFLKCDQMARNALDYVRNGELSIQPDNYEKTWHNWLENIRDWCISRQLWWGHKIPIYTCYPVNNISDVRKVAAMNVNNARIQAEKIFQTKEVCVKQIDDVLDTWFSSALLPFTSNKGTELQNFYPLSLMETGNDILFFWVARMVMLGSELTQKLPFDKILLHGVICDVEGRKMSKSLGNVIAPEHVIEGRTLPELQELTRDSYKSGVISELEMKKALQGQKKMFPLGIHTCGVDALRFTLCSHNIKSHFISFDVQECRTNKLFGNKLWQATKFAVKWCSLVAPERDPGKAHPFSEMDRWILSRLSHALQIVNSSLESRDFHNATGALKNLLYFEFCDVYLEYSKTGFKNVKSEQALNHCWVLFTCLDYGLRSLSLFMPYLCQHLHEQLFIHPVVSEKVYFPEESLPWRDELLEKEVEGMLNIIVGIRRLKKIFNIASKHPRRVRLITSNAFCKAQAGTIAVLSGCEEVVVNSENVSAGRNYIVDTLSTGVEIHIFVPDELLEGINVDEAKMLKKKEKLTLELESLRMNMSDSSYKSNVSEKIHEGNLKKVANLEEKINRIDFLSNLSQRAKVMES